MTEQTDISRWDEEDSQSFIDYGRYFVPERETQIEIICDLIPAIDGLQHVVDLCCGEGVLCRAILDHFPTYHVHGLDISPTMLEAAKQALSEYGRRFDTQIFDLPDSSWRTFPWPLRAVVSSLAIHHLDDEQKQQLSRNVYAMLAPGGVFIIADLIWPTTQTGINVAGKGWDEATRQRALQLDGNLSAYEQFHALEWNSFTLAEPDPLDKMTSLYSQLQWLEQAGFANIDVYWMKAGHAIFGGVKEK
jgi:tRNA (cmo5U34)-methyltransferase